MTVIVHRFPAGCSSVQLHLVGIAVLLVGPLALASLLVGSTPRRVHIRGPSSSFRKARLPPRRTPSFSVIGFADDRKTRGNTY